MPFVMLREIAETRNEKASTTTPFGTTPFSRLGAFPVGVGATGFIIAPMTKKRLNRHSPQPESASAAAESRAALLRTLLPEGVPALWCPPLTHYDDGGAVDARRIAAHFRHLSRCVRGFLVAGSTGDGWELSPEERRQVFAIALKEAPRLGLRLLLGALTPKTSDAAALIREDVDWIKSTVKERDTEKALAKARVCGFAVCPPRGKELRQGDLERDLASILELDVPTAVYQLPQVTQNEVSPKVTSDLAARFTNFILFKDTSGRDRWVLSGKERHGVFALRGAEGDYVRWFDRAGGPYNGFLLGASNCFARELYQVIEKIRGGRLAAARALTKRLTAAGNEMGPLVRELPDGNPFTNANKAMDHFFAHGPEAAAVPPPRLHAGSRLPTEVIRAAGEILRRYELMPGRGYLE